ncbi:HalOD1 output domain-containing protein [Halopiger thermotolerans]
MSNANIVELEVDRNTYRARYDFETTTPTVAVVTLLELVTGREPAELDPLYEAVDPEAMDSLIRGARRPDRTVSFIYRTFAVTVRSDGTVTVRSRSDAD